MRYIQHYKNYILSGLGIVLLLGFGVLMSVPVSATGLKIAPLKYEELLELGSEKTGYVDVANPTDFNLRVRTSVEAFRQVNNQGDLEFFPDEQLEAGIVLDVDEFELGPREAARIFFTIKSNNLPEGGIYATVFFETVTENESDQVSTIGTVARVGTLLILQNGDGDRDGEIVEVALPFWQFGKGVEGRISYHNPNAERAVGFSPELSVRVAWGEGSAITSGLVLPGITRDFSLMRPGDYFGLVPVTVTDEMTGEEQRVWVFAITGLAQFVAPLFVLLLAISIGLQRYFTKV